MEKLTTEGLPPSREKDKMKGRGQRHTAKELAQRQELRSDFVLLVYRAEKIVGCVNVGVA